MVYSTKDQVKAILHIKSSDTAHDAEITNCIEDTDAWIDTELKEYTTVPLTTVPNIILVVSKYGAAALFKEKEESKKATVLYQRFQKQAKEALEKYVKKTFHLGKIRSG